jgi:hypothetical protein
MKPLIYPAKSLPIIFYPVLNSITTSPNIIPVAELTPIWATNYKVA